MSALNRLIPAKQRRFTVLGYGLSAATLALTFLLGFGDEGKTPLIFWAVALAAVAVNLWSGGRLRSPEWGFYDWKRRPDALDERQRERALWAVAQTHQIVTVALAVLCGVLLFCVGATDFSGLVKRLVYVLLMVVALMGMLPTAILAWTEPDLSE